MLGIAPRTERTDNRATIEAGSTLLLYTDGLVERRGEDIDEGLQRALDAAGDAMPADAGALLRRLVRAGGATAGHDDDVTVLVLLRKEPAGAPQLGEVNERSSA
jgi:serine phosphatase RsbU (regulator of sigma subunit)